MLKTFVIGVLTVAVLIGCGAPARAPLDLATATTAPAVAPIAATTPSVVPSPANVAVPPTDTVAAAVAQPTVTPVPPTVASEPPTATPGAPTAAPVTPTLATTPSVVSAPLTVSPSANTGPVKIVSVTGAKPGSMVSVAAQAAPNALCSIMITTPKGKPISAKSLAAKNTDINGQVTWTWKVPARTAVGTGSVAVTCGTVSATAPMTIG